MEIFENEQIYNTLNILKELIKNNYFDKVINLLNNNKQLIIILKMISIITSYCTGPKNKNTELYKSVYSIRNLKKNLNQLYRNVNAKINKYYKDKKEKSPIYMLNNRRSKFFTIKFFLERN